MNKRLEKAKIRYFKEVKSYYDEALEHIKNNDFKAAHRVLYTNMPVKLYDFSISFINNRNNNLTKSDKKFQRLIEAVTKAIDDHDGYIDEGLIEFLNAQPIKLEIKEKLEHQNFVIDEASDFDENEFDTEIISKINKT